MQENYVCRESTVDTDDTICLFDTIDDTIDIERFSTSYVDDFSLYIVFLFQLFRDLETSPNIN